MLTQWQTRGLIPADDQPGATKAHRKAVIEYEDREYLQQQEAWVKAGQPPWYGPAKSAMNKAEKRQTTVTCLLLHLKCQPRIDKQHVCGSRSRSDSNGRYDRKKRRSSTHQETARRRVITKGKFAEPFSSLQSPTAERHAQESSENNKNTENLQTTDKQKKDERQMKHIMTLLKKDERQMKPIMTLLQKDKGKKINTNNVWRKDDKKMKDSKT
ncbi:hypothetical protein F7725_007399 [Dissostichus mawsoni]|uniref:Uncharacterized protein n=1 Tax=Dissostichus mawsoni TaxID=36200 RepID=A0A7J5XYD0_DISMA|nr:hypothetical protein F7725_007399 [Dissostichus mawsoni]